MSSPSMSHLPVKQLKSFMSHVCDSSRQSSMSHIPDFTHSYFMSDVCPNTDTISPRTPLHLADSLTPRIIHDLNGVIAMPEQPVPIINPQVAQDAVRIEVRPFLYVLVHRVDIMVHCGCTIMEWSSRRECSSRPSTQQELLTPSPPLHPQYIRGHGAISIVLVAAPGSLTPHETTFDTDHDIIVSSLVPRGDLDIIMPKCACDIIGTSLLDPEPDIDISEVDPIYTESRHDDFREWWNEHMIARMEDVEG